MDKKKRINRLQHLLARNKSKIMNDYGSLFNECIQALGEGVKVYSPEKSKELYELFQEQVPFTPYTRIDWSVIKNHYSLNDLTEVKPELKQEIVQVYWSYGEFPVLESKLEKIVEFYDDITAVSADLLIFT